MLSNQPWLSSEDRPANRLHSTRYRKELTPVALQSVVQRFSRWKIAPRLASRLMNVDEGTWSSIVYGSWKGTLSVEQLERASVLVALDKELRQTFEQTLADGWLTARHEELPFRGRRPIDLMAAGGLSAFQTVRKYLKSLKGLKPPRAN